MTSSEWFSMFFSLFSAPAPVFWVRFVALQKITLWPFHVDQSDIQLFQSVHLPVAVAVLYLGKKMIGVFQQIAVIHFHHVADLFIDLDGLGIALTAFIHEECQRGNANLFGKVLVERHVERITADNQGHLQITFKEAFL